MRKLGLFGLNVLEEYGGAEVTTRRDDFEELRAAGLAGGSERILYCAMCCSFRDREQKLRFCRAWTGERAGASVS